MKNLQFEWDDTKNIKNQKKYEISFEEAKTVFYDEFARIIHDPDHSKNEDRFVLLGLSYSLRLLMVVHTYKEHDDIIRIISARKATQKESQKYQRKI
jgi:uncharacterized protein